MKKAILLAMVIVSFTACKKNESTTPALTKTEMLTGKSSKKWKVTGYQRAVGSPVTSSTPDELNTVVPAYRDNLMVFYMGGLQKMNEGPTGANPSADYSTVSWVFQNNEADINCTLLFGILGNGDAQLNCSIVELSDQKLVLDNAFPFGITVYYTRWTLVPVN